MNTIDQSTPEKSFKLTVQYIFLIGAIIVSASIFAQAEGKPKKETIPVLVKAAFAKEFPSQKASWEKEAANYEAEFELNGTDASALYDAKGNCKALEIAIKKNELPADVLPYLKKNYPTNKITETAKITDDKKVITYEVEIKKEGKACDILFDAKGKFIKIVTGV